MIDIDGFKEYLIEKKRGRKAIQTYCSDLRGYSKEFDEISEMNLASYAKMLKQQFYNGELSEATAGRKKTTLRKYCDFIGYDWKTALPIRKQGRSQKPKPTPKKTLEEVVLDVEQYNKKHGTRLSYGKYKVLQMQGKI